MPMHEGVRTTSLLLIYRASKSSFQTVLWRKEKKKRSEVVQTIFTLLICDSWISFPESWLFFSFPSELQTLLQSRSHQRSANPLIALFPSLQEIVSEVIAFTGYRQILSNWIKPHRFGKLGLFFTESDSCLASVPARVMFVAWADAARKHSIIVPAVTPWNLTLPGQPDRNVKSHFRDSPLFWKQLSVARQWGRRYAVRMHPPSYPRLGLQKFFPSRSPPSLPIVRQMLPFPSRCAVDWKWVSRFPNGRNQISRLPGSGGNSALIEEIIEETRYTALCLQIFHQRPQRDLHSLTARKLSL